MRRLVVVLAVAAFLSACGSSDDASSPPPVPSGTGALGDVPDNPMELAVQAGLTPEDAERLEFHLHAHLDVFVDGTEIVVPANIGIDVETARKGIPCATPCISPLHTHDTDGVLHTESATERENTLGQFFTEWNVKLDENCVGQYCKPAKPIEIQVDGKRFDGDPRTIELSDQKHIAIVIGTPPADVPTDFEG